MINVLVTEWIKTKRTAIRWITALASVIFPVIVAWYFSLKTINIDTKIFIFKAFFEIWTVMVIPLGSGLISGIMIHQEELAGGFCGFLGSKTSRKNLYIGKLTMLILLTSVSTLLAVFILYIALNFILNIQVSWSGFIFTAITAVIAAFPLLTFHLWISFAWGMGASIGIGAGGVLMAALMATGLGSKVWQFVPWAWPVRLSGLVGTYLLYLPGMKYPHEITFSGFITNQAVKSIIIAGILFVSLLVGGLIWFERWEGRKIYD